MKKKTVYIDLPIYIDQVFSQTLAHENSNIEIMQRNSGKRQSVEEGKQE